jgi:hypothetical protein
MPHATQLAFVVVAERFSAAACGEDLMSCFAAAENDNLYRRATFQEA